MTSTEEHWTIDEPFEVQSVQQDGRVHVSVRGELDISTSNAFEDAIDRAVRHGSDLVIDLRDTTFMGARALGAIAVARQRLPARASVTVRTATNLQRRLFTITGLDRSVAVDP